VSFKDRYGIRVMNLSIGTDSTQSYRVDPLNYAVERAWGAGIVVVVSASNRGPAARTISKPGDDPFVVTVGAVDDRGTSGIGDDALPNFSSHGPTAADGLAKPDIVAPGAHLVSLNAPGSAIATNFPSSMAAPYRRGSGTSMSTAVVSGEAALLLAQNPCLTPDRVKYALMATAHKVAADDPYAVGAGMVDVSAAVTAPAGLANQGIPRSNGTGSLDLSRGTVRVQADDPMQTVVSGEMTAQLLLWNPVAYTGTEWTGVNWYGSDFDGVNWYGVNWYGSDWAGVNWYGSSFYGQADGVNWYGVNWYGSAWYGVWE
jgi:serine protease AprX